jgi:hypothetical protein
VYSLNGMVNYHMLELSIHVLCLFFSSNLTRYDLVTGSLQASAFGILFMSLILFQDDPVYKMNLADLKSEASKAYNEKDYPTAVKFYSVVCI